MAEAWRPVLEEQVPGEELPALIAELLQLEL